MPVMMAGRDSISCGRASRSPCARPRISCSAASSRSGRLSIKPCTMVVMASTAAGMSCGSASASPCTSDTIIWVAASMSSGRLSMIACVIVITACTAAGISWGSSSRMVVRSCEKSCVTVSSSVGSSSAMASNNVFVAVGSAFTIFSMTGVMLVMTFFSASAIFPHSCSISASAFPKPTSRFFPAACKALMEPEMVCSASFAVVPVMSMLV